MFTATLFSPLQSIRRPASPWLGVLLAATLLSGCDLLLGSDPKPVSIFTAQWEQSVVATGKISALDMAITNDGVVLASYIHEGTALRVSRLEGDAWVHLEGPVVSGTGSADYTHIAAGPGGDAALMYASGSDMHILSVGTSLTNELTLSTLEATMRGAYYPRPAAWTHESADLAYGTDGRIRAVLRDADVDRLWLFRQEGNGWSLGVVPGSQNVLGTTELMVGESGYEHVVFQANSQGHYYWRRPADGWMERLRIPDGLPYLLRLRSGDRSVLAMRQRYTIRVAEEVYDTAQGIYKWHVRSVVEDENLFWHNMDLVLDERGFPSLIYILYQDWDEQYQIWFIHLLDDGTWGRAQVAGNLRLPDFSPFNIRMVREASGRIHILLTGGHVAGVSGVNQQWDHHLMHIYSDTPLGDQPITP